jgi:hypothetical protein
MTSEYIPLFYNEINNKYSLENFKILCSSQLNNIIETQFFNMLDETTVFDQFQKDYPRGIYQINGNTINQENMNATQFIEQIFVNNNININYKLFIPLVCNQVSQSNISTFFWKYFHLKYGLNYNTSHKLTVIKKNIFNIECKDNKNILINILSVYELHKVLSNNITAPRKIIQVSQKFDLSKNQLHILFENIPLINNQNKNQNNSNISSKFQKNLSILKGTRLKSNVIPIKKKTSQIIKKNPDFYLISFNEGAENYSLISLQKYTSYLSEFQPKILAICTQESKSKGESHFQHIMKNFLININENYELINKFNASSKKGDVIPGKTNKNVRTRIYYRHDDNKKKKKKPSEIWKPNGNIDKKQNENKVNGNIDKKQNGNIDNGKTNKENSISNRISNNSRPNSPHNNNSNNYFSAQSQNSISIQSGGLNQTTEIAIVSLDFKKSERSGLGDISKKTLYKGSIYAKLILNINKVPTTIIIVNSHLYYQKNGNTGLKKRQTEFIDLIHEFQLIDEWKQGAHIFFVGDLNFRLFSLDNSFISFTNLNKPQIPLSNLWKKKRDITFRNQMESLIQIYQKISKEIIDNYASNQSYYKYHFLDKRKKNDELYQFINNYIENLVKNNKNKYQNNIDFFKNFLESIQLLGLHLTSKYEPNLFTKNQKFYNTYDQIYEYNNKVFNQPSQSYISISKNKLNTDVNTMSYKKNISSIQKKQINEAIEKGSMPNNSTIFNILPKDGYFRIPSMTDRILFSLRPQEGKYVPDIKPDNFNIFLTPDDSDHKLISLAFNFKLSDKNKVSSNKKVSFQIQDKKNNEGMTVGLLNNSSINSSDQSYQSAKNRKNERNSNNESNSNNLKYYNA